MFIYAKPLARCGDFYTVGRFFWSFRPAPLPRWAWPSGNFLAFSSRGFLPPIGCFIVFKVPPIPIGHSIVLGNMDVGINTQNLMAIIMVIALSVINIFGVKTGALIQNILPSPRWRDYWVL